MVENLGDLGNLGGTGAVVLVVGFLLKSVMTAWKEDRSDARLEREANRNRLDRIEEKLDFLIARE